MLPRHARSGIVVPPHALWFLALWLFMIPARAEWRLEQRSRVDGNPPTVTASSSGLGSGDGWANAGVGSSPDPAATQRTDLFANAEAWDFSIGGEILIAQYASGMLFEQYRWHPSPGRAVGEIEETVDLEADGVLNLVDASCAGEVFLQLEYASSLPLPSGGAHPRIMINESRSTESAGSYSLGIPDVVSITGNYEQREGRYPLSPTPPTTSPTRWFNSGCATVYWRRHTGSVRVIAWANGDFFDDAESIVNVDGLLVSKITKLPCPQ